MARLHFVRHAAAGSRSEWNADDTVRPLSKKGWRQAAALAERLAEAGATELWASPYVRCVQTLEPLGERLGRPVRPDDRLAEGADFEPVLDLLAELPDGAVLCSHGDVIPATVEALVRRGAELVSEPDWRKASTWELERAHDGTITTVEALPPPSL